MSLLDFAVITIFAREFLEGGIILGEYKTIIQRGGPSVLEQGVTEAAALQAIYTAAWVAVALALVVIAAIAIPLSVLSRNFDDGTSKIIEGLSKMVAGVCLLQLSLKLPKFLGVYGSTKKKKKPATENTGDDDGGAVILAGTTVTPNKNKGKATETDTTPSNHLYHKETADASESLADTDGETRTFPEDIASHTTAVNVGAAHHQEDDDEDVETPSSTVLPSTTATTATASGVVVPHAQAKLSLRNMRFNVAWNIWREVAECGVFLIPFFLSGDDLKVIPLSAVVGAVVGSIMAWAIYVANQRFTDKRALAAFVASLLLVLSAGLFTGGAHNLETETTSTRTVWKLHGDFWSIDRLPMTVFKPFGYNDSRTVLEMCTYWSWLILGVVLHVRKYHRAPKLGPAAKPAKSDTNLDEEQGAATA